MLLKDPFIFSELQKQKFNELMQSNNCISSKLFNLIKISNDLVKLREIIRSLPGGNDDQVLQF